MANHYISNYFAAGNAYFIGNGIVSIFFVLSGYGIFYSIQREASGWLIGKTALWNYFCKRTARIYPIYWLSLLSIALAFPQYVKGQYPHINTILLNPLVQADGIMWFMTSLVQCYVLAPFLYAFFRKTGLLTYVTVILILMFLSYTLYPFMFLPYTRKYFVYRYLFLGHVFLFALGIALPKIISEYQYKLPYKLLSLIAFIIFFVLLLLTRKEMPSGKYLAPVFILSAFLFCYCVLVANPHLILQKLLVLLGNYAYSLYLFHLPFFQLLCAIGIITYGSIASLLYTVLLSPILVMLCILIEKSLNSMASLFIALCVRQRDIHDTKSQGGKGDFPPELK